MSICKASEIPRNEAYTDKYAAVPPARRAYAPEGRGMRVTQQMGVFRQPLKKSSNKQSTIDNIQSKNDIRWQTSKN